jgi:hypothetical protein
MNGIKTIVKRMTELINNINELEKEICIIDGVIWQIEETRKESVMPMFFPYFLDYYVRYLLDYENIEKYIEDIDVDTFASHDMSIDVYNNYKASGLITEDFYMDLCDIVIEDLVYRKLDIKSNIDFNQELYKGVKIELLGE